MASVVLPPSSPPFAANDAAAIRAIVEAASLAMVREFLAKRRYRKTLDMLSTELVSHSNTNTVSLRFLCQPLTCKPRPSVVLSYPLA